MPSVKMRVVKYIPDRLYGFVEDDQGRRAFFHVGSFQPGPQWVTHIRCEKCPRSGCSWKESPPPPILGESVDVEVDLTIGDAEKAPRASRLTRCRAPRPLSGGVEIFDVQRAFGFIRGEDGESYHLHRSEMVDGAVPVIGQTVMFYAGERQGRPRACHARICP